MLGNEAAAGELAIISNPAARTATFTSPWIDVRKYEGDIAIMLLIGTVSGTTPTLDCKIQHSAAFDGSSPNDVAGATFTQYTDSTHTEKLVLPANSLRGWIALVATIAGTTPSFQMACALLARPKIV